MTSSSGNLCVHLLDLHADILFKLVRDYISFEDKLCILWNMPEFRPYLEDRAAWITSTLNISVPFLDWIQTMKSGWYIHAQNWSHVFLLKMNPYPMTFSLHHFIIDKDLAYLTLSTQATNQITFQEMKSLFTAFLEDFIFMPTLGLPTYHLKDSQLLIVPHGQSCQSPMRFYDWDDSLYELPFYEPRSMKDGSGRKHFKVALTFQRKLVVECLLAKGQCFCEKPIITLLPFCQGNSQREQLKVLNGETIPLAACQTFQAVDETSIQGQMLYFLKNVNFMQVEVTGAMNKSLRNLKLKWY